MAVSDRDSSGRSGSARPQRRIDTPIAVGGAVAVALAAVGAFVGFDALGTVLGIPVLIAVMVVVFAVGAAATILRIAALRRSDDGPDTN